jgi:hypothetical protein
MEDGKILETTWTRTLKCKCVERSFKMEYPFQEQIAPKIGVSQVTELGLPLEIGMKRPQIQLRGSTSLRTDVSPQS